MKYISIKFNITVKHTPKWENGLPKTVEDSELNTELQPILHPAIPRAGRFITYSAVTAGENNVEVKTTYVSHEGNDEKFISDHLMERVMNISNAIQKFEWYEEVRAKVQIHQVENVLSVIMK